MASHFWCRSSRVITMRGSVVLILVLSYVVLRVRSYSVGSRHFGFDVNLNHMVIFIYLLFANVRIILITKDFLILGIDNLSRIWHNFLEFWIINSLPLCTCMAFWLFLSERHWLLLCERHARLTCYIISQGILILLACQNVQLYYSFII